LAAFEAALTAGATHLESDVQATADGVAVLFHDLSLEREFGMKAKICELSLSELRSIATGDARIPTLAEALAAFPAARFNLDLKTADAIAPLVAALAEDSRPTRVLVSSFSRSRRLEALKQLRLKNLGVATSADGTTLLILRLLFALRLRSSFNRLAKSLDALQIPVSATGLRFDSNRWVAWARSAELQLNYWTINDATEMKRLVKLGATGIVTDRTDIAAHVQWE
jgi:glycerophosphoryl diester phosphodiesterase